MSTGKGARNPEVRMSRGCQAWVGRGLVWLALALAGCGNGFTGKYVGAAPGGALFGGKIEMEFHGDGSVDVTQRVMGRTATTRHEYELDGDRILVQGDVRGDLVLTIDDEDRITGAGMTLHRVGSETTDEPAGGSGELTYDGF